jgi:hypothetical protein
MRPVMRLPLCFGLAGDNVAGPEFVVWEFASANIGIIFGPHTSPTLVRPAVCSSG